MYDAIVSGLGPGGATAAYELALNGLNVLAFDKENFPRYKPCGGCLSLKVEKILPFDFKEVVEDTVYGAIFTFKSKKPIPVISQKPLAYNINRDRFDNLLKERARTAGAEIREGERVINIEEAHDGVIVKTSKGAYRGKVLIGADGANGFIGRDVMGLNPKLCAVAIEAEIPCEDKKLADLRGKLLIDFNCIPHGYAWIFPKEKNLSVGIAGISDRVNGRIKDYFHDFVKREGLLSGMEIKNMHGWTIPYFHDEGNRVSRGRVLTVGDAARLVDPFIGEGIYYAIRSGQLAANVIKEKIGDSKIDLSHYSELVSAEFYPEFKSAARIAHIVYNYPRLWYAVLKSEPALMQRCYNVIRGEEGYGSFYAEFVSRIKRKPWRLVIRWLKGCVERG